MTAATEKLSDKKWKARAIEACAGCGRCDGNPPERDAAFVSPEADDLYDDVRSIISYEDAGSSTDWELYPIDYLELCERWRSAEKEVKNQREIRMQAFLRGWMKSDG